MLIPGLPIELWTYNLIMGLANSVGKFIRLDRNSLYGMDRRIAKLMVEFDMSLGLPTEVEIVWGTRSFIQRLDYYKLLFRCFSCHETGHLQSKCPLLAWNIKFHESFQKVDSTTMGYFKIGSNPSTPLQQPAGDLNFTRLDF